MKKTEMVPGRKYRIKMDDCCIQGEFVGTFIRYEGMPFDPADDESFDEAVFDIGRIGPDWGQWTVEEILGS